MRELPTKKGIDLSAESISKKMKVFLRINMSNSTATLQSFDPFSGF